MTKDTTTAVLIWIKRHHIQINTAVVVSLVIIIAICPQK
jgi:hypothetical protein